MIAERIVNCRKKLYLSFENTYEYNTQKVLFEKQKERKKYEIIFLLIHRNAKLK